MEVMGWGEARGFYAEPILVNPALVPRTAIEAVRRLGEAGCAMPRVLGYPAPCAQLGMQTLSHIVIFKVMVRDCKSGDTTSVYLAGVGCDAAHVPTVLAKLDRDWVAPACRLLSGLAATLCGRRLRVAGFVTSVINRARDLSPS